jgi:hypothetical protein
LAGRLAFVGQHPAADLRGFRQLKLINIPITHEIG